jgi:hypothetical protein
MIKHIFIKNLWVLNWKSEKKVVASIIFTMLRTPQYTVDQRVFMVNRRTRGDTCPVINYDFKKVFPLSGRDPDRKTITRNKKKFDKEG